MWEIISRWTILFLLGTAVAASLWSIDGVSARRGRGRGKKKEKPKFDKFKMRFTDMALKILCEEDEWKAQLSPVRSKFQKCLGLEKLYLDGSEVPAHEKKERDPIADLIDPMRGVDENPYCKIAETWIGCTYLLQGLNCFEPNAQALGGGSSSYTAMLEQLGHTGTDWPEDNLNVMAKIYKSQCDSARFAAQSMQSYGGMGMGDYYGGGYDYDGTDGVDEPQETNKDL